MSRTAFLTGGSSGIGTALVRALSNTGWEIIAPQRSELDLSNLDEVSTFATDNSRFPTKEISVLIHTAGMWHDEASVLADKPFASFTPSQIMRTMNVGLTSFMILANQLMAYGKPSHIIAISGTFENGGKGWLPYYTSKRALEDFVIGLSHDSPEVMIYGISPADTATPAYERFFPEYIKLAQSPDIVANLAVSLLAEQHEFMSGTIIEARDGKQRPGFHV